jgi:pimeloyl-ACP methyl ester carboxylesterase
MMDSLMVGDASLNYSVRGEGPGLLVPWCNFPWPDMPFVDTLAERFTVVMASPRGYQRSTRLTESQEYSADLLVNDLLAICDHTGLESFSVLGYSLTAAITGWLASASARVEAVVLGGFPLLGSYEAVLRRAEKTAAAMSKDEKAAEALRAEFDTRAVLTFYRELAERPDDALVDLACPIFAFWGTNDDILQSLDTTADFGKDLTDRGIATLTLDGCDHAAAILGLGDVIDKLTTWLAQVTEGGGR